MKLQDPPRSLPKTAYALPRHGDPLTSPSAQLLGSVDIRAGLSNVGIGGPSAPGAIPLAGIGSGALAALLLPTLATPDRAPTAPSDEVPAAPPAAAEAPTTPTGYFTNPTLRHLMNRSHHVGDGLNMMSSTFDFVGKGSDTADILGGASSGLALATAGLSLMKKVDDGDRWGMISASLKVGGNIVSLAGTYAFPNVPNIALAAGAMKLTGSFIEFVAPETTKAD